jgi:hypothetical protein
VRTLCIVVSALAAGVVIVIAPLPLNLFAFFVWIFMLYRAARAHRGKAPGSAPGPSRDDLDWLPQPAKLGASRPRWLVAIHVAIVLAIIVVADRLPVKQLDEVLNRPVALPKTTMTLGEFAELRPSTHAHPLHLSLEPEEEKLAIHFPTNQMRLGEVIRIIEQQTNFRHHVSKCGNESTILWGSCIMVIWMEPVEPPGDGDSARRGAQTSALARTRRLPLAIATSVSVLALSVLVIWAGWKCSVP